MMIYQLGARRKASLFLSRETFLSEREGNEVTQLRSVI